MRRGPRPGQEFVLDKDEVTIGRGRTNDIIIHDNEVSRSHCRLVRVLDDYEIHDLRSTNGTFVSGQRLDDRAWMLATQQIIELGDSITLEYFPSDPTVSGVVPVVDIDEAASERYFVIKRRTARQLEIYPLESDIISLGREEDNSITLPYPEISRHHVRLSRVAEHYFIEDLGSLNGTRVNGKRLEVRQQLHLGDYVEIGLLTDAWYTNQPESVRPMHSGPLGAVTGELNKTSRLGEGSPDAAAPVVPPAITPVPARKLSTGLLGNGLEPGQLEHTAFLVYARSDWADFVCPLYMYLDDRGSKVWVDQYLTPDSGSWVMAIEQALTETTALIAVLSEDALSTPYVQRAIRHFHARSKPIFLLHAREVKQMPLFVQGMPLIPFDRKTPENTFEFIRAELAKLSDAIGTLTEPKAGDASKRSTQSAELELADPTPASRTANKPPAPPTGSSEPLLLPANTTTGSTPAVTDPPPTPDA